MGLFDASMFNSGSYNGLLGDLLSRLQFPQTQPSAGFADSQGNYGGVSYPIFGQPTTTELSAQSVQPQQYQPPQEQPQYQLPPQPQRGGFGDAFRGALANAHNGPLGLLFGGIAGAAGMGQGDPGDNLQRALIQAGVPPAVAVAARQNPEVLKTIAPQLYTKPKFEKLKDALGQEQPVLVDEGKGTIKPLTAPGTSTPGGMNVLAPGVGQVNSSLTGDAYLNQFGPEVQAAVKSYINGDVMPSGNPRQQAIANFAKTVAQKYGQDTGTPVSDALYAEKRRYRSELGATGATTAGGQSKAFNQAIEHASSLSDTLEKLDNWNGFGIPILASAANTIRQGLSNEQKGIADKAAGIGQQLAGEVGKLFSGTQGGGQHERMLTMERFSTVRSKPQLAAALEATLETMRGGLTALEGRRDQILGPNSDVKFISDRTQKQIDHIEEVIARLKGGQSPSQPAPQSALPAGWSVKVR